MQTQSHASPSHTGTPNNAASIDNIINQSQDGHGQHAQGQTGEQPQKPERVTKGKYSQEDFQLQRTLGTGSFGRVHLVQSKHNHRFYAMKVLKKAQVVKMKQIEHTNDERRMLNRVRHPFLVTLWGTWQDSRNLYMVMDFVEGGELFSLLRKSQRFPNPVAKFYAAEVTLALEYLHAHQIIYRDLKPENLLLDRHGHLKITDFGFAKDVPDITWTLCGTPDYLAPEVVSSKGYNKSVDWWSLGILIFEMLCGFTPFWDSGSPVKIYENILRGKVKYPPYLHADAVDLLSQLITSDLTKRLGNLHGGPSDVKNHPWFAEVTWDRLARKDIDAPYIPPIRGGQGDASQYDKYPEETEHYGQEGDDTYGHLFPDF
jgi:protein kinase A